ncbi:DNA polymerase iota [Geosmithia morbida]|uniref:DNA polymerase iota n=1 Tax=Geosmithia morbida TaxID=1094350 RepID=A0A9P4YVE7_9HYPO|nr:DNA polymerase iota [Geosmithia morbida]KAF4123816.1 DNA polymerase iota [Geosmithia morbida]
MSSDLPWRKPPKRIGDERDYDCFYAQVVENKDPSLKSRPVGVKQKSILATCNYNARSRGVRKLMLVSEAKKACPDLVLVDGEDLTPFRDVSKRLFEYLKKYSWSGKMERLGLDEIFMDVTDIVEYNMTCMDRPPTPNSFFYLSKTDPEKGFICDMTTIAGCAIGARVRPTDWSDPYYMRLILGSRLALHLRTKLEDDFGYTSTCGISTNKLLSKLCGGKNKPRNQTTLVAPDEAHTLDFMDGNRLRGVPGIGFKMASSIEELMTGKKKTTEDSNSSGSTVTVGDARASPEVFPASIERVLDGTGAEKGVGSRVWALLHGVDPTEVKKTSDFPSQIGIEDTYPRLSLSTMPQITEELLKLTCSLIRRMRTDLLEHSDIEPTSNGGKWLARPRTLRLSIRSWHQMQNQSFGRSSRSSPLPGFVFDTKEAIEEIAENLVSQYLVPLLRRLNSERGSKWNLQLINICVANMDPGVGSDKSRVGRDIGSMFKNQEETLKPWKIVESDVPPRETETEPDAESETATAEVGRGWETAGHASCPRCGCLLPTFALPAHLRFHDMGA